MESGTGAELPRDVSKDKGAEPQKRREDARLRTREEGGKRKTRRKILSSLFGCSGPKNRSKALCRKRGRFY